jgi:catechol 2,3-dioxygenase-like lactoylglutathione lyase family enzyme
MFDHVKFGVSDFAASKAFFLEALAPLGVVVVDEGPPAYGVEMCAPGSSSSLCVFQTEEKPAHLHLAFTADTREQVDAFHRAALRAGARDNGAPGLRPNYAANYYAAFDAPFAVMSTAPTITSGIYRYRQATDDLVTSGQPREDELAAIAGAGYQVVINLALHDEHQLAGGHEDPGRRAAGRCSA